MTASTPTTTTPDEWPRPHVQPATQPRRRPSLASGAMAARWSGPESTCMTPASAADNAINIGSLGHHPDGTVQPDDLAIEHLVLEDVSHE